MTTDHRQSRVRPARPLSPIAIALMILLIWWVVAHNSGSGWVQVLGDAVFGMILVGLLGPAVALTRVTVTVIAAPTDAAVGAPANVSLTVSGRARVRPVQPPGPRVFLGPGRHGTGRELTLLPTHRGRHDTLDVEVATAAPFGLQWWSRHLTLRLPAPLHVSPRLGPPVALPEWADRGTGTEGSPRTAEAGDARGVRDYRAGDRRRRVHWAASAHAGKLMVREMEEPSSLPVTLRVRLPSDAEAAERAAERALGTVVRLMDRGAHVLLDTVEPTGVVVGPAADRREAGRRIARATNGSGPVELEVLP